MKTVQVHTYKQILPNIDYSLLFVHVQWNVFNYTIVPLTLFVYLMEAGQMHNANMHTSILIKTSNIAYRLRSMVFPLWISWQTKAESKSLVNNKFKVYCYLQFMWCQIHVPTFTSSLSYHLKRKHQYHYNIADC